MNSARGTAVLTTRRVYVTRLSAAESKVIQGRVLCDWRYRGVCTRIKRTAIAPQSLRLGPMLIGNSDHKDRTKSSATVMWTARETSCVCVKDCCWGVTSGVGVLCAWQLSSRESVTGEWTSLTNTEKLSIMYNNIRNECISGRQLRLYNLLPSRSDVFALCLRIRSAHPSHLTLFPSPTNPFTVII